MKIVLTIIAALFAVLPLAAQTTPVVTTTTSTASLPQYEIYTITMVNNVTYAYPDEDVTITAVFTAPSGKTWTIGGFNYDTYIWEVRFAPKEVGNYTWTVTFDNGSGSPYNTTGSFACTASSANGFLAVDPANSKRLITEPTANHFSSTATSMESSIVIIRRLSRT